MRTFWRAPRAQLAEPRYDITRLPETGHVSAVLSPLLVWSQQALTAMWFGERKRARCIMMCKCSLYATLVARRGAGRRCGRNPWLRWFMGCFAIFFSG